MTILETINDILVKKNGIILTKDVIDAGISKPTFYVYAKKMGLDKISHGVFAKKDRDFDKLYFFSLRSNLAIFSHETALKLHGFDVDDEVMTITLPTGYNPSNYTGIGMKVYTVKKDLYDLGRMEYVTEFGHTIHIFDLERTICDLIRSRNKMRDGIMQDIFKEYVKREDKDLKKLTHYAFRFRIEKLLKSYLDLLL